MDRTESFMKEEGSERWSMEAASPARAWALRMEVVRRCLSLIIDTSFGQVTTVPLLHAPGFYLALSGPFFGSFQPATEHREAHAFAKVSFIALAGSLRWHQPLPGESDPALLSSLLPVTMWNFFLKKVNEITLVNSFKSTQPYPTYQRNKQKR